VSQDYPDIEHIFVDGVSSDDTLNLISALAIENKQVVSEKDAGIYDALNKGIDLASGDIIAFLHSDDTFASSDTLSKVVACFVRERCSVVYGDLVYVSQNDPAKVVRYWKSRKYDRSLLTRGWMPAHPAFFMKKEAYEKLGKFDTSYKISGDYDALLRYLLSDEISTYYLPEVISKMRVGGVSNRSLANIVQKMKEDYRAMKNHGLPPLYCLLGKNLSKLQQFFR
jgi:glycosyltransferase